MKKVLLLCLDSEKLAALTELQKLGLMHLHEENSLQQSSDRSELEVRLTQMHKALAVITSLKDDALEDAEYAKLSGAKLFSTLDELLQKKLSVEKTLDELRREYDQLAVWGDFSQQLLAELRDKNIFVYLCQGSDKDIQRLPEEAANGIIKVISEGQSCKYFALITQKELDEKSLPLAVIPETSRSAGETLKLIGEQAAGLDEIKQRLLSLKAYTQKMRSCLDKKNAEYAFLKARDMMDSHREISIISGFVPVPELDRLTAAAHKHGWALKIDDPASGERVPTMLREPKIFRIARPIFDFIGISPDYNEQDVSICFLFFFTIFFGMIVGDAGYGVLFVICTALAAFLQRKKLKDNPPARLKITLFFTLSTATVIWGALNGTYFGIASEKLPEFMRGIKSLSDPAVKDKNIQYFCFMLAGIHLSIGRIWQALINLKNKKFFGEIGWTLLIWANFFTAVYLIVDPSSYPKAAMGLYVGGLLLILCCGVNWKDAGDIFNFPFGVIGSFVDVLSYIRLFAVGMATYYIANSFNNMGSMVMSIPLPSYCFPLLVLFAVVVILFGHLLNIALAFMGVLVHGIRLNTLEFSNHMGMRWSGFSFRPFSRPADKRIKSKEQ